MLAGFASEAGYAGPLGEEISIQMGGYCLIGDLPSCRQAAVACVFDGTLTSHPDSNPAELICRGYEDKGADFFFELEGPFRFSLVDEAADRLFLMRSSEEPRPIYWQRSKAKTMRHPFSFADSLKTWGQLNRRAWHLDRSGLSAFLHLGFFPSFFTPIEGVDRLLPGYLLCRDQKGFTLQAISKRPPSFSKPTEKKTPKCTKTFRLIDLVDQIWELDIPLATLFVPTLFENSLSFAFPKIKEARLDSIYYDKAKTPQKRRLLSRLFQVSTRPFMHPFWLSRKAQAHLAAFEKRLSLFTLNELQIIAPRICRHFNFQAFTTKITQRQTNPINFLDDEAIHMASAFDPKAKNKIAYHDILAKNSDFEGYIPDEMATQLLAFIENGALCDMDIVHKEALRQVPLSKWQLWSLAQLEMWLKLFYEGPPTEEHRHKVKSALLVEEAAPLLS